MFLGRARLGTVGESARRSPVEGLNEVHSAASSDAGLDVEDDPDHGQKDDYAKPSDTHEHDTLRRVSPATHTSTDLVLGTLPVDPAFAPPIGGSCTQPATISIKAIAAITASDFMIFPDGKTYQGIS